MSRMRVIIAEDDPITVKLLQGMLQKLGHEVCATVENGRDVIHKVQELDPTVVLMDIHLKDSVDGVLVTRQLLEIHKVPVIFISGTTDAEVMNQAAESGAVGFIQKPVSLEALKINLELAVKFYALHKRIRQSEILHRSIFDKASVGIYLAHPDGYYMTSNRAFASMLGFSSPEELVSVIKNMDEQVYDLPEHRAELLEVLKENGSVNDCEAEVYGRDGDKLWVSENCTAEFDAYGNITQYEVVVLNITARKQAEQASHMSLTLLQNTIDSVSDIIVVQDMDENIILSNLALSKVAEQYNWSADQLKTHSANPLQCGGLTPFQCLLKDHKECAGEVTLEGLGSLPWHSKVVPYRMPGGEMIGVVQILHQLKMD